MALIILCGFPASGKSAFAAALSRDLAAAGRPVTTISDGCVEQHAPAGSDVSTSASGAPRAPRAQLYGSAASEKRVRAELRACAERALDGRSAVIVDSLNYVGGFRYELWCAARTHGCGCVVVHVGTDMTNADLVTRDAARSDAYGEALVRSLIARFEAPDGRRRWDVAYQASTGSNAIASIVQAAAASPHEAPRATRAPKRPASDALAALDRATRGAEAALLARIRDGAMAGAHVRLPAASRPVILKRVCRAAELRNMRRALMQLTRMHPPDDMSESAVVDGYVDYINAQLGGT